MLIDDNTARFLKPLSAIMHKRVKNKRNITHSAGVYLLKVNNTKTGTRCEICSKGTIKTPERSYWRRSGFLIVNLEQILHLAIVFQTFWNSTLWKVDYLLWIATKLFHYCIFHYCILIFFCCKSINHTLNRNILLPKNNHVSYHWFKSSSLKSNSFHFLNVLGIQWFSIITLNSYKFSLKKTIKSTVTHIKKTVFRKALFMS